jgi:hypothetical protein
MKRIVLLAGTLALFLTSSCTGPRNTYPGPRASAPYGARGYADPFGGWDVTRSGSSIRVKHLD